MIKLYFYEVLNYTFETLNILLQYTFLVIYPENDIGHRHKKMCPWMNLKTTNNILLTNSNCSKVCLQHKNENRQDYHKNVGAKPKELVKVGYQQKMILPEDHKSWQDAEELWLQAHKNRQDSHKKLIFLLDQKDFLCW